MPPAPDCVEVPPDRRTCKGGYGRGSWKGQPWLDHRRAWVEANGPIPEGMFVLHRCDNPPCINPDHLFLGTHADNMRDMVSKERGHNPNVKLNAIDVSRIRQLYATGRMQGSLALEFGVTQSAISRVVNGLRHPEE